MAQYRYTISEGFWQDLGRLAPTVMARAMRATNRMMDEPYAPELHPHPVQSAEQGINASDIDKNYRLIWKHIQPSHIVFLLADKHDEAYRRASRQRFTLEGGVVKVADIVEVGARPAEVQGGGLFGWLRGQKDRPGSLFVSHRDRELLDLGVPEDILPHVRALEDLEQLPLVERLLPEKVYDRLLSIALGIVERPVVPDKELRTSLEKNHGGDALYLFVNSDEFKRALAGDMEEWMLFLAPDQRRLINRAYAGPARVKGVAGSGKTVVAVHRARCLAQQIGGKKTVLFLTYGNRLPNVVYHLLERLAGPDAPELEAVEYCTIHQWCARFCGRNRRSLQVDKDELPGALAAGMAAGRRAFPQLSALWKRPARFFQDEIRYAIKGRAVDKLEQYLELERSGRGTALGEQERRAMWVVYQAYQDYLGQRNLVDWDDFVLEALRLVRSGALKVPYRAAIVDEIQDLTEATMHLIRTIVAPGPNDLFLVGDGLQRLFPGGYTLGRLGIDITGRGTLLRRNYRNTREILRAAYAMVSGMQFNDLDDRESSVEEPEYSLRSGPPPMLRGFPSPQEELTWVASEIESLKAQEGYRDRDFALLYRMRPPYSNITQQSLQRRVQLVELTNDASTYFGPGAKHSTFDSAKGLEFKVVFVVGVTDGQFVPRDDWSLEGAALEDSLLRERSRLFVAMTRARDRLYLTYSRGQPSRFLAHVPGQYLARKQ